MSTSQESGQPQKDGVDHEKPYNRMEIAPIRLPHHLESVANLTQLINEKNRQRKSEKNLQHKIFQPQVSSFVLATNGFGDFSKCTIMSQLLTNSDLEDSIAQKSGKLWREFVHQPQTGRCLVFLQVLKTIIREMTDRYRSALETLESDLDLEVCISRLAYKLSSINEKQELLQ